MTHLLISSSSRTYPLCVGDRLKIDKHKAWATTIVAPKSVGSSTTKGQMKPTDFQKRVACLQFSTALLQQYFFQGRRNKVQKLLNPANSSQQARRPWRIRRRRAGSIARPTDYPKRSPDHHAIPLCTGYIPMGL